MQNFRKVGGAYVHMSGNPTLESLDGEIRATLQTILAPGWPEGYAEQFGIYLIDTTPPEGKVWTGEVVEGDDGPEAVFADAPPPPVPAEVTRAQGKAALIQAGLWSAVESYVEAISDPTDKALAEVALYDTLHWRRDSPFLNAAAVALGMTEQQLDDLFRQAAQIAL